MRMFGGLFFFFKQKTAYEVRISDWSSDVCSSDLSVSFSRVTSAAADAPMALASAACSFSVASLAASSDTRYSPQPNRLAEQQNTILNENNLATRENGRASGRERVCQYV